MKHFVFAITLFASELYFGAGAIMGMAPSEDGAGAGYKSYCIAIFSLFLCFYLFQYFGKKIKKKRLISIMILVLYAIIGIASGYSKDVSVLAFVAYSIPASGIAIYYAENRELSKLIKWIDVILLFVSISLLFSIRLLIISITGGDSSYSQNLSYVAAYCFVLYLFMILFGDQYDRFSLFKKRWYKYISIIMLPYLIGIMFFSGGRGALGTLAVGSLILLFLYQKQHVIKVSTIFRSLIVIGVLVVVLYAIIPSSLREVFSENSNRVFSFFDTSLSMKDRTSGRDEVMAVAVDQIKQNPFLGSGIFSYKDAFSQKTGQGYPHNFFIEILLQGGVVFLFLVVFLLLFALKRLIIILKEGRQELVLVLGVFAMTSLMYSGSYIQEAFFWFFFMYIYNFKLMRTPNQANVEIQVK